jgi:tetratricopeptide (TPR) repeat protein
VVLMGTAAVALTLGLSQPWQTKAQEPKTVSAKAAEPGTRNPEPRTDPAPAPGSAADLYARGRAALLRHSPSGLEEAEKFFNDAMAADPLYARAYAGLADVWQIRGETANEVRAFYPRVVEYSKKAIELDPDIAEAHASLGNAYAGAWKAANGKAELETALRLNPNYASAHQWLARLQEADGALADALTSYRRAVAIEPKMPRLAGDYARALFLAGRHGEALAWTDRVLAAEPEQLEVRRWRAWALLELDRMPDALAEARRLVAAGGPMDLVFASTALYRAGSRAEADEAFRKVPAAVRTSVLYLVMVTGRRDDVIALMAPAIAQPSELPLLFYLSAFDPIRGHARFREILRSAEATSAHRRAQEERAAWRETRKVEGKR